ncbi:MAG: WS/DGAT domain-containing protein, partial [Micromonosporaceae bacterium]
AAPPRSDGGDTAGGGLGLPDFLTGPLAGVAAAARTVRELVGLGPAVVRVVNELLREQAGAIPFQAPTSMLNVPITGARRFAAQGWPISRIQAVGRAANATLNDVMLAMCAGALRHYLQEQDALPDKPLVAAVPVSLRGKPGVAAEGGNAVGLILCSLGTHLDDPAARLSEIVIGTQRGKRVYAGLTALQATALSAVPLAALLIPPVPGMPALVPPPFNILISNVPGPRKPLYFNGARLQGVYPLSIPFDGQALNITVTSYVDSLEFGLTGCRRSVPHLQRLLTHLETSLTDLEKATA